MFEQNGVEAEAKTAGQSGKRLKRWQKIAAVGFAVLLIFMLGVGVGNGRITLGRNRLFSTNAAKNLPANLDYTEVEKIYDSLKSNFDGQLDVNKLLDGLKQGLANASGDPYTEYF